MGECNEIREASNRSQKAEVERAFRAGWRVNASYCQDKGYLSACEDADWQRYCTEGQVKEPDKFLQPYADAGHDTNSLFAAPIYQCRRCGAHQIDLSEDLVYGDMRKCVPKTEDAGKDAPSVDRLKNGASAPLPMHRIHEWIASILAGKWIWARNSRCKYVTLKIDTRSGAHQILDRDGIEISADDLLYQYSKNRKD